MPEIVVAVHRERYRIDAAHVLAQVAEQLPEFVGHRVADRIRDVDGGRAGLDRRLDHLRQEVQLGTRGILGRELHVLAQLARDLHAFDCPPHDLLLRHVQLELPVDGAGGEEHVQSPARGGGEGAGREFDVLARAARETGNDGTLHLSRDRLDRLPVAAGCRWKPGLDDIDAQLAERTGDAQLFRLRHAAARGLLAVAQGGVEDQHSVSGRIHRALHRRRIVPESCKVRARRRAALSAPP